MGRNSVLPMSRGRSWQRSNENIFLMILEVSSNSTFDMQFTTSMKHGIVMGRMKHSSSVSVSCVHPAAVVVSSHLCPQLWFQLNPLGGMCIDICTNCTFFFFFFSFLSLPLRTEAVLNTHLPIIPTKITENYHGAVVGFSYQDILRMLLNSSHPPPTSPNTS